MWDYDIMARVFIAYKHSALDVSVKEILERQLRAQRHEVFADTDIAGGEDWAKRIEEALKRAEVFIVLLTADSIQSDYVRREVEIAAAESRRPENPLRIIPVRVGRGGELPYQLGARLNPLQQLRWDPAKDGEGALIEAVTRALNALPPAPAPAARHSKPPARRTPSKKDQATSGDRNISIGGNVKNSTLVTGDQNVIGPTPKRRKP